MSRKEELEILIKSLALELKNIFLLDAYVFKGSKWSEKLTQLNLYKEEYIKL